MDEQKLRGKVQQGDLYCNPIWGQQSYHKVITTLLNKCRERVCVCVSVREWPALLASPQQWDVIKTLPAAGPLMQSWDMPAY